MSDEQVIREILTGGRSAAKNSSVEGIALPKFDAALAALDRMAARIAALEGELAGKEAM